MPRISRMVICQVGTPCSPPRRAPPTGLWFDDLPSVDLAPGETFPDDRAGLVSIVGVKSPPPSFSEDERREGRLPSRTGD